MNVSEGWLILITHYSVIDKFGTALNRLPAGSWSYFFNTDNYRFILLSGSHSFYLICLNWSPISTHPKFNKLEPFLVLSYFVPNYTGRFIILRKVNFLTLSTRSTYILCRSCNKLSLYFK